MADKLAVIRLKGENKLTQRTEDALRTLRLGRRNRCSIVPNTPSFLGMLKKTKDFATWGEINDETLALLQSKSQKGSGKEEAIMHFSLNSPKKGYGRKGLKHSFKNGGAMGYRGSAINDLISRMVY